MAFAPSAISSFPVPKGEMQELKKLRDAFSERVAHLSWKRSEFTPDQQLVIAHEIEGELRPLLLRFLAEAVPERLCEGFLEEARTALLDERGTHDAHRRDRDPGPSGLNGCAARRRNAARSPSR